MTPFISNLRDTGYAIARTTCSVKTDTRDADPPRTHRGLHRRVLSTSFRPSVPLSLRPPRPSDAVGLVLRRGGAYSSSSSSSSSAASAASSDGCALGPALAFLNFSI